MKGDLSRETFDRALHFSAVRLQQGRVVTDADWNEQADLTRYRAERQARDTIGGCGAPLDAAGYGLVAETNALAVHAVNANVAWIAAEDGVLLWTANGGTDWTLVDVNTQANLYALAEVGGIGWVVGEGGVVRKTSNQGASWIAQNAGTFDTLRGLSVFDADHAWAVGDGGTAIATSDGGASWRRAVTGAARLHAVHFIDELAGLAVRPGPMWPVARPRTSARWLRSAPPWRGQRDKAARSYAATTQARPGCRATRRRMRRCTRSAFAMRTKAGRPGKKAWCCIRPTAG
jgi:hypothetical protein